MLVGFIKNPISLVRFFYSKIGCKIIRNDELYLKIRYRLGMGLWPDFKNPKTYQEKMMWSLLYDKHPEYTNMVDKDAAKKHVATIIGEEYIIPTYGVWESFDEIDFNHLPEKFVLKCTHDSGRIFICTDKSKFNFKYAKKRLTQALKHTFWKEAREYQYRDVPHRIIAEKYMVDESGYELKDYKIFCFDGKPKCLFVATDRTTGDTKFDFYDTEWNNMHIRNGHPNNTHDIPKPKNFEKMLEIASKLSQGIPHVRVDLYNCNGEIYFGELTFFHFGCAVPFEPREWDYKFGEWFKLPKHD